jgi:hypothetical protein
LLTSLISLALAPTSLPLAPNISAVSRPASLFSEKRSVTLDSRLPTNHILSHYQQSSSHCATSLQGRISRGIHGLPRVSLRPALPYPSTPCRQPPLKRLYSHFRDGHPQVGRSAAVLLPPWIPHAIRPCYLSSFFIRSSPNSLSVFSSFVSRLNCRPKTRPQEDEDFCGQNKFETKKRRRRITTRMSR